MEMIDLRKRATTEYKVKVWNWAKRLDAEEITIHEDWSVTLSCKDGYICYHYKPTTQELNHKTENYVDKYDYTNNEVYGGYEIW